MKPEVLKMPQPEPNGFVKTLNNMGYMTSTLDPFSAAFVNFAPGAPGPALDIGAAYGVATIAALNGGAHVVANDVDPRHLEILLERTPSQQRNHLELKAGSFPEDVDFSPKAFGAILVARVFHFFPGVLIETAVQKLYQWLNIGGKLFIVGETPYLKNFKKFIPIYEARKQKGDFWPGYVEDVLSIAPERGKSLPPKMNFLDPEVLNRVLTQAGFFVEKAEMFARPDFPEDLRLDGRESVGAIAIKK